MELMRRQECWAPLRELEDLSDADDSKVEATFKNDVLSVDIAKSKVNSKIRQIAIH